MAKKTCYCCCFLLLATVISVFCERAGGKRNKKCQTRFHLKKNSFFADVKIVIEFYLVEKHTPALAGKEKISALCVLYMLYINIALCSKWGFSA